ncbi:MAG: flagellar hook-associated protein FlgK [Alphaproteobacteria bacterium GWF2_58_20]|nr:MAG: flagellar hook-associated protein FlgK [Alphaproteobacteria bacterium GWF2_58_20]
MAIQGLQSALLGIKVAQRGLDLVAQNTANVSTPGYTRKILPQHSLFIDNQFSGVWVGETSRNVDGALLKDYWKQVSNASYYGTRATYMSRIEDLNGSPDSEISIAAEISTLNDRFIKLSSVPDSTVLQNDTLRQAQTVAETLNRLSESFTKLRGDVQTAMETTVEGINATLTELADINKSIVTEIYAGHSTADLEDYRDQLVNTLSGQMEITSYKQGDGTLVVQTRDGQLLADTEARLLSFTPTSITTTSAYPATAAGIYVGDPSTNIDLCAGNPGGKLGALIEMRDTTLPQQNAQIDEIAHKMALRFDAQGLRLFSDSSGNIPADAPPAYVGFAGTITVNPAVVADSSLIQQGTGAGGLNAGSNAVINNILAYTFGTTADAAGTAHDPFRTSGLGPDGTLTTGMTGTATLVEYARTIISRHAQETANTQGKETQETTYSELLLKRLQDSSCVNLDEEVANMIELQRNYAAAARVFQSMDQIFEELLNTVR